MLRQLFSPQIFTIRWHLCRHEHQQGSPVVARLAGRTDFPQVYDVQEVLDFQSEFPPILSLPDLLALQPSSHLEVQLHPHGEGPWFRFDALYLRDEDDESDETGRVKVPVS